MRHQNTSSPFIAQANRLWLWVNNNPLATVLLLLFITEALYKLGVVLHVSSFRISASFKVLLQLLFLVRIWQKDRKQLIYLLVLIALFLVGQWALDMQTAWIKNLTILDEYLYLLLLLMYVNTLRLSQKQYSTIFSVFEWLMVLNSVLIIVGFLLDIGALSTYLGDRFGYSGFLIKSGAASYIYTVAIFYFCYQCIAKHQKKWWQLLVVLSAAMLLGTKTVLLSIVLVFFFFTIAHNWYKKVVVIVPAILALTALTYLMVAQGQWVLEQFPFLKDVYDNDGLWSLLTSYRNNLFVEDFVPVVSQNWNVVNYLFGGCPDMHFRSQFELFDAFFFFGILGAIYYFTVFYRAFATFKWNKYAIGICVILLILALMSGNFFYNAVVGIYIVFIKLMFQSNDTSLSASNSSAK